jgi:3-oxoacyl-[acyl-carrier-protein] synthase I
LPLVESAQCRPKVPECRILSYGCSSAAGTSVGAFWDGLAQGVDFARWEPRFAARVCAWPESKAGSVLDGMTGRLLQSWQECLSALDPGVRARLGLQRLGVILASTKGCVEDWVWKESGPELERDPMTPILEAFVSAAELTPAESICVSQACASSMAALSLGYQWLRQGRVEQVLVLAVDHAGLFIHKGFGTLKILSSSTCRPFSRDRDGVVLGDAAAAILLSGRSSEAGGIAVLEGVATETEGYAVTRPDQSGESLRRACAALPELRTRRPDLVIAHATGTAVNDAIEDRVLFSFWGNEVPISATKWSIGHTLGASAAMDVIAACEVLRRQQAFCIAGTEEVDPAFGSRVLVRGSVLPPRFERVLVTSLGFGGVHAGALLRRHLETEA